MHIFTTALLIGFGLVHPTTVGQENRGCALSAIRGLGCVAFRHWLCMIAHLHSLTLPRICHLFLAYLPPLHCCSLPGQWVWLHKVCAASGRHRCLIRQRYDLWRLSPNGQGNWTRQHTHTDTHPPVTQQDAHQVTCVLWGKCNWKKTPIFLIFLYIVISPQKLPRSAAYFRTGFWTLGQIHSYVGK